MFDDMIISMFGITFKALGYVVNIGDLPNTLKSMLDFSAMKNISGGSLWAIGTSIHQVILPIAYSLLTLFFMMELLQKTTEIDKMSWQRILMIAIKFFIVKAVVDNSMYFLNTILNICSDVFVSVSGAISVTAKTLDLGTALAELCSGSMGFQIGTFAMILILWFPYIGTAVGAIAQVFFRTFKIIVMVGLSPIPISLLTNENTSSTGKRFFMNFAAIGLEACIILIFISIYSVMIQSFSSPSNTDVLGVLIGLLMSNSLLAIMIAQAGTLARELTGGQ